MANFEHIVNVIPLTRVSLKNTQIFSYTVPLKHQDQMRPGQLVKIPFGRREILGVTSSMEMHRLKKEVKGLKPITDLVDFNPVLTRVNLALAEWISKYYMCPLGIAVRAMLPRLTAKPKAPERTSWEKFDPDFLLTEPQRKAVTAISSFFDKRAEFLLHGVTGSGKTEVYMRVIERILESGKQVIMLVPEISLTSQAIERFARRFGMDRIAVFHSRLKDSERTRVWQEIRESAKQIIIGPRSAVFAPVKNLGLIVVDEEHDPSYKQYDQHPKYDARAAARKLSEAWNCPLIYGDATPSVETYFRIQTASPETPFYYIPLPYRIKADLGMPQVKLVDMKRELAAGNTSVFSEFLRLEILHNIYKKKQIILFLNRRGAATFVMCRDCGHVQECRDCSVPLVYHLSSEKLICHHCGRKYEIPANCPKCAGPRIKYFGLGTQGLEQELIKILEREKIDSEKIKIARMDRDATARAGSGGKIYQDWASGKTDILIGTQMITKGWDVSNVGLVGVITADTILHLPDYRSNERTFQILTQVAGRTGRGDEPGKVIMQTYNPENFAVIAAKSHDYLSFFQTEIAERRKYKYPPFYRLVKITIRHRDQTAAEKKADEAVRHVLEAHHRGIIVLGPAPSFIARRGGEYQYQIALKFVPENTPDLRSLFADFENDIDLDVDPESLL